MTNEYQIVVVDSFYDLMGDPEVRHLFGKLAELRIGGYLMGYPYGVLPFSGLDLPAIQLLVCRKTPEGLEPVSGFKAVTLARCREFQADFPALDVVSGAGNEKHMQAILDLIADSDRKGESLCYIGSWTIHPELRKDGEAAKFFRDTTTLFIVKLLKEYGFDQLVTFAALKFKVEKYHQWVGMKPLRLRDKILPDFAIRFLFGDLGRGAVVRSGDLSPEALAVADRLELLWRNRTQKLGRATPATPLAA
jgi:hypothetical protein